MHRKMFPGLGKDQFDCGTAGKKAATLHELARAGVPVPPGFVIPDSLREHLADSRAELLAAVESIGGFPVAVRSSSHLEDLDSASFAGMYETYLDVASEDALMARIGDCFRSARSDRVRDYMARRRIDPEGAPFSVLVQRLVDSRCAGVFFTLHPISGKEEQGLLEACSGHGERLVSGHVTPSRYVVELSSETILETDLSDEGALLDADEVGELVRAGVAIQALFGAPQDIEWAIDAQGELFILQSRPITAVKWRSDVDEFTNADFKDGGVSARVCLPLMYSLYEDAMQTSMQRYFVAIKLLGKKAPQKQWIRSFYGRAYWNASEVKRRLFRVPGFDERTFDLSLGIQKDYSPDGPVCTPTTLRTIIPVIPTALALEREYRAQLRRTEDYGRGFLAREAACRAQLERLEQTPPGPMAAHTALVAPVVREILALQRQTEIDYFTTIYNNANLQSDFKTFLDKLARKTGHTPSMVKLISGLRGIGHLDIQTGLLRLVAVAGESPIGSDEWQRARQGFLDQHYYHADAELDLMCPRWGDQPARVDEIVGALMKNPAGLRDPATTHTQQAGEFEAEKAATLAAIDRKLGTRIRLRGKFVRHVERARAYLVRREEMRDCSTRAYHLVRRAALLLASSLLADGLLADGLLMNKEDIFFLVTSEIETICAAPENLGEARRICERIRRRKLRYQGYRHFAPPDELGGGVVQVTEQTGVDSDVAGAYVLKGLGCSPGRVRGPVRVVKTLDEAYTLEPGEILVTRFTDPGWTAVLGMVAGVITEVGGMLSHAAVIGREYGIPAILNLPGATAALRTGQEVTMDGETGDVIVS